MPRRSWPCSGWQKPLIESLLFWAFLTPALPATDYSIQVRLDPETRILRGSAQIDWTNTSQAEVGSLCFHQYYNAWQNPSSSFLNSNRMTTRDFSDWRADEWAYSRIERLVVRGAGQESEQTGDLQNLSREDGNSQDQTVSALNLNTAVPPGESIQIDIQFENRVPRTFARTGYRGEYFLIAQWFPKLGVVQPDGAWHCPQFIQTEFFADFGTYDVRIEVPENWVVGATGARLTTRALEDGYVSHRFHQQRVHDFAWATSPHFQVIEDRFESPGLFPVNLELLLMPDHLGQEGRYLEAVRTGLKYYGEWFGEYPYEQLTIIDPAYRSRTGGMEYPTFFTGGTRWWNPEDSGQPESVTIHEFGHQIWYGVVANNEFDDAWLDEGLNTYSTTRLLEQVYARPHLISRYLDGLLAYSFSDMQIEWRTLVGSGTFYSELKWDVMSTPSWRQGPAAGRYPGAPPSADRIYGSGAYGINSYTKPAQMLKTLEGYLGWQTMREILSTFYARFQFAHPTAQDFIEVSEEVSGQDLDWFWDQTYYSSNVCDYAVDTVLEQELRQRVVVRRWGEAVFPVEVEVVFESGIRVREPWSGQERWKNFDYVLEEDRIIEVRIDPDNKLALDINPVNNSWVAEDESQFAGLKWGMKWMLWLQNLLQQFAALA